MNIFVTNDDGITSTGIKELVSCLEGFGDIYVFAPASQQSACGHGLTVRSPLSLASFSFPGTKESYKIGGTPADCVKLGLNILKKRGIKIDYLFSGINHGSNLGTDTLYSGTVAGAIEGIINKIPSVAISICSHFPEHFENCRKIVPALARIAIDKLDENTVMNVNIPDLPFEEIKGIKVAETGPKRYNEDFTLDSDNNYNYGGSPIVYKNGDNDITAFENDCIAITPLQYNLTSYGLLDEFKSWNISEEIYG